MIQSFRNSDTRDLFEGNAPKGFPADVVRRAHARLLMLHAATTLDDLKVPPGNRLEKLVGDRDGQHSIRINGQWRICFKWVEGHASEVEVVDYHQ